MKDSYKTSVSLRCITCGGTDFNVNGDKSWVKCKTCGREYSGGYTELVEMNQENIDKEVNKMKEQVTNDLKEEFTRSLENAFRGNKYIKIR